MHSLTSLHVLNIAEFAPAHVYSRKVLQSLLVGLEVKPLGQHVF